MSDKKEAKVASTAPATNNKAENKNSKNEGKAKTTVVSPSAKVFKAKWTLDRCKRYARRFTTETVWASSSPASYKAAVAHGWRDQCVAELGNTSGASLNKKAA